MRKICWVFGAVFSVSALNVPGVKPGCNTAAVSEVKGFVIKEIVDRILPQGVFKIVEPISLGPCTLKSLQVDLPEYLQLASDLYTAVHFAASKGVNIDVFSIDGTISADIGKGLDHAQKHIYVCMIIHDAKICECICTC